MTGSRADNPSQPPADRRLVSSGGPDEGPPFFVPALFVEMDLLKRHPSILSRETCAIFVVDLQVKLLPAIPRAKEILARTALLLRAADVLDVPVLYTEQNPQGLGPTAPEIAPLLAESPRFEKVSFSGLGAKGLAEALRAKQVLLAGIETHVCILQTALDLIAAGRIVHVAVDAVAARRDLDHETALHRLASAGAVLTTVEAALFEILREAGNDPFREVLSLVKTG